MRDLAIALSLAATTALGVAACGGHSDSGMASMSNMSVPTAGKYKTTGVYGRIDAL
ncbi:hypothetical protein WN982_22705 [Paraburkholderia sp. IMGN_8]|uniref:hypothetical protein n=1 Tax=Paraburkholderia sp. IMGN_8 TaxID=3136564 RepID=UPI0031013BCC